MTPATEFKVVLFPVIRSHTSSMDYLLSISGFFTGESLGIGIEVTEQQINPPLTTL